MDILEPSKNLAKLASKLYQKVFTVSGFDIFPASVNDRRLPLIVHKVLSLSASLSYL